MTRAALPDDIASLKAMVLAQDQLIQALKLTIAKLRHEKYGASRSGAASSSISSNCNSLSLKRTRRKRHSSGVGAHQKD